MVCKKCGEALQEGARVCDFCGETLPVAGNPSSGPENLRQGRAQHGTSSRAGGARPTRTGDNAGARETQQDAGRPDTRRGIPLKPGADTQNVRRHGVKSTSPQRFGMNWALLGFIACVLLVVAIAGTFIFLKTSQPGQLVLARMGREANATAWWTLGQEYLDQGYIEKAVTSYELAYSQEPDRDDIYDKLLLLAEAYEAAGRLSDAERVFTELYKEHDKENIVAYKQVIRLMLDQDRLLEATSLMQTAFENTGDADFRNQRQQLIPVAPTATLLAGSYLLPQTVQLQSSQGYEIYYIIGEGNLPEDGQLYSEGFLLNEGTHVIRAICLSSELYSDEMSARYIIKLPTPGAPKSRLAAGSYKSANIKLYTNDEDKNVTIYYTIDSTEPDRDSPIYTGDAIKLPGGRVTLRAVAINKYGKVSNELNVIYDIERTSKNYRKYYRPSDVFTGCEPMKTSAEKFTAKFGMPTLEEPVEDDNVKGTCTRLVYPWGEARFVMTDAGRLLYMVDTTNASMSGPRSTKIAMAAKDVIAKFRDMGQVANAKGNRSLYYDKGVGEAKYTNLGDNEATITYACWETEDDSTYTMTYFIKNDEVVRMRLEYAL